MTTRLHLACSLPSRTLTQRARPLWAGVALAAALALQGAPLSAADLTLEEGVVVKFGAGSQLVVRDRLLTQSGVILTSDKDDAVLGQALAAPGVAKAGDWLGVRVEKSVVGFGGASFSDILIKHAGERGEAALYLRANSPSLQYFQVSDSVLGLRLVDGAKPALSGASFLRNSVGLEADGITGLSITSTQFSGNTTQAIVNKTPASAITATGNWWGDATGPKDAIGNPNGLGDAVSAGVSYGSFLASAPLLAPTVRLTQPATYFENRTVQLALACINATEYRLVEGTGFVGVPFQPLSNGRTTVDFTLSDGDGRKTVSVQYRNATGTVTTASVAGGVLVDTQAPIVAVTNPAAGSVVTSSITVEANVTDASGIAKVEFYLDGKLVGTRTAGPYTQSWSTDATTDGEHTWRIVATDIAGRTAELSRPVLFSRAPVAPDTEGPVLAELRAADAALAQGATFGRDIAVSMKASDRSGVSRVEWLLDGVVVATASGSGTYSASIDLDAVPNGPHTLVARAFDSLNNISNSSFNINVAHVAPDAPRLSGPAAGSATRLPEATVTGTAQAGSRVQLIINGAPVGALATAGADGRFTQLVTLLNGLNQIQATAADTWGTSALSAAVNVTLDQTVPSAPGALTASSQALGKVRLAWLKSSDANVTGYQLYRAAQPFSSIAEGVRVHGGNLGTGTLVFEDLPAQQGTWYYRVVSVNAAGATSEPTNQVQALSDAAAPRATSVAYTPLGKVDAATGRIGQGRVNVVVTVNEVLQSAPYLSIVPQGGTPLPVDLAKTSDLTYAGSFLVDSGTASGTANVIFSARDVVGNRGTEIDVGDTLKIDTEGPAVVGIALSPTAPIKNDGAPTLQATFTFSKAQRVGAQPTLSYLLSGPVRAPVALSGLTQIDATTWRVSFKLPSDAGLGGSESLSFAAQSVDDLDNISTKVTALNRFQVYQGELPPLNVPFGFKAVAQPGGKVRLDWQAVAEASAYQIYRQGPADAVLLPLIRASGESLIDQTPRDGSYRYALATVRSSNGQESISSQTAAVEVLASATAPGAPQNLALQLTGQGIMASWQGPLASEVKGYRLYRASGTSITTVVGLTPLKSGIVQTASLDPSPSPTQGAYVVTAVDAAGNESALSNSAYLNASLLPVVNLKVQQLGKELPVISWDAPNGNLAGYLVYVGADAAKVKLTPAVTSSPSLTDSGFTSGERRYTVASVDAAGIEMPRSIVLPSVSTQVVSGLPIKRGIMNKVGVQVVNLSATTLSGVRVVVKLPTDKAITQFKDHRSDVISLAPNETRIVPVIVGGYTDMPGSAPSQIGVEIAANEGEMVKLARDETLSVVDGTLVVGMATDAFTRGATGQLRLTIENTSEVDVELLTATNNGNSESSELRFKILDADGNVLSTQAYKQSLGAQVVTLTNGLTVARIPAGQIYTSDAFTLNVPGASPNSIRVRLEVDKLRFHSGQDDQVIIPGQGSEKLVSLLDTAYVGDITDVSPVSSFGDQDVRITGQALDRNGRTPLPNTRLKLVLNQQGFERVFSVLTDGTGNFVHVFKPTVTDAGLFKVSAVHPEITDRPEQKAFTINRVSVGPAPYKLDIPRNYPFSIPFTAKAGPGTSASNLRLVLNAASQPTGQLPAGVSVQLPSPVSLTERQTLNVPVVFSANNEAQPSGSLILDVISDEQALTPIGRVAVNYTLSLAKPNLTSTPSFVETGLAQGDSQVESVEVRNNGLQDALNLSFALTQVGGAPAPAWAAIASRANGSLAVGERRSIDLSFTPPAGTAEGVYEYRLTVVGDNVPTQSLNVYVSVTQSGQGNVLFKASDIYTATVNKQGKLIPGLAGARVTLQNEDVPTITQELNTDALGEALFQNLPSGRYKFRASAANHQEVGGRVIVKPGITFNQSVFLEYNLVTVEWSVREITIQDRYEITLNATFETDVPAAVVVIQPTSVNLPKMNAGDVYYGELTLTNHGLIRADKVKQQLPRTDGFFRYEFLVEVPDSLAAKQRVTIPYRVVALQPLDVAATSGTASGGGCYNYSNTYAVTCSYVCANGSEAGCGAQTSWFSVSGTSCAGSGGGGGGGGGGWGGGGWGGGGTSTPIKMKGKKCVYVPKGGTNCD
jgi:hypothetical protein